MTNEHQCVKLDNISSIRYGRSVNKAFIHEQKSTMMLVQSRDLFINGVNWDSCAYTDFVSMKEPYFLEQGDVLFFVRSEGNNAIVIDASVNDIGIQAIAGPLMFILRCDTRKIIPEYLAWWLNQEPAQTYFKSKDPDGQRKSIVRETLEETPICIPTLNQQRSVIETHNAILKEIAKLQMAADKMACKIKQDSRPLSVRFNTNHNQL